MPANALKIDVVTSLAELTDLRSDWHALEEACQTDLPFQTWEWSTSWWHRLRNDGPGVRDVLKVCVVRTTQAGIVGIAPLMITERPGTGPIRLRVLQFIGADPNITELRSMLCVPGFEQECYQAVQAYLLSVSREWDWIAWEGVRANIDGGPILIDRLGSVQEKSAFVLDLAPTWQEFKTNLGRNIKQSLRKCYNSLKRDGLSYTLRVLAQPEEIECGLADFFRLHSARAHLRGTVGHPDVFAQPRARDFLSDVCRRLAERHVVRVYQLWVDDRLVATRIGFVMGSALYLYYSGWDPNYARYSVMTTLLAEVIQDAIAQGTKSVHLSTGADLSKTRWGAREIRFISGRQLSSSNRARALHFAYEGARRLHSTPLGRACTPAFLVRGFRNTAPSG